MILAYTYLRNTEYPAPFIDACENVHTYDLVVSLVATCAANVMLNNLCRQRNDLLRIKKEQKANK